MNRRRIIVSIDFGTTYSGVAWADTTQAGVQNIVSTWPAVDGTKDSPKVPTELRNTPEGWQWGFQIPEGAKRIRFFKLKLDEPLKAGKDGGESAQELTKIYLTHLHNHFMTVLEKHLSRPVLHSVPMDFVVTVPAIWSNAAKQATERAAAMAGFCGNKRILLISEPEAAALYTLKHASPSSLQVGRRFVVCDAGGGTVDLISYEVTSADRLQVKEVTEGTGGKCGSAMLNMRFRRHLKQIHGDKSWTDERLVLALSEFENYKKNFSPRHEPLTLRVDPSVGLWRNKYTMSQEDMRVKIFEPIIKDVICLIKEQIALAGDEVDAVILVGGFGQSRYLRSRVRDAIAAGTQVLQPEKAWAAVVKGAALFGLGRYLPLTNLVEIKSRVARKSYGTCLLTKYDMMKHDSREAFWSDKEQEMVVTEMCWFIRKGESYPETKASCIDYQCDLPVSHGHLPQTEIEIFVSDDTRPPMHVTSGTRCVARLFLDLNRVSTAAKKASRVMEMGRHRYYSLQGAIEAAYGSAMVTYAVKLGGVVHDVINVRYEM